MAKGHDTSPYTGEALARRGQRGPAANRACGPGGHTGFSALTAGAREPPVGPGGDKPRPYEKSRGGSVGAALMAARAAKRPNRLPLVRKGRWHGEAVTEGIRTAGYRKPFGDRQCPTTPPSWPKAMTPPLTQGRLWCGALPQLRRTHSLADAPCALSTAHLFPIPYSLFSLPYSLFPLPYSPVPGRRRNKIFVCQRMAAPFFCFASEWQ